ncbi:unnamed protein product [Lactuca saligna]|uniref:F-box associated domain-containing protein n=1 Tax=Lactuca saligna TaxID=75948 RepID=A0AA35ZP19_LACSI|nr:unnamed protein product [Lactuca saligna]
MTSQEKFYQKYSSGYWQNSLLSVLGVLDGKLCVMSRAKGERCEVWVMEEYRVAESWVKHHVFSQFRAKVKRIDTPTTHVGMIKILEYVDSLVWIAPVKREINYFNISDHFARLKRGFNMIVNGLCQILNFSV